MKKTLLTTFLFFIATLIFSQNNWKKKKIKIESPVCYGSNEVHRTYVEPPYELLKRLKSTGSQRANIIVKYDDEFEADSEAKAAFEAAVNIWEGLLSSTVPIYMYAYWDNLDEGVLGSCGPWEFYENLDFLPRKNTYYPVALVEKMKGEEITDSTTPDIIARFNKDNDNWYFGLDGNTPIEKYDFFSIVLHEIGHGLGYTGMAKANVENNLGFFCDVSRLNYFPGIFDCFLINRKLELLIDTVLFKNPSGSILNELTSGFLYFKGDIAKEDSGLSEYPRIYAPGSWDNGSSIYHLDESTYRAGTENSLMTPSFGKGEAIHSPGPMSLGMLFEMGWSYIQIAHDEHPDIENLADLETLEIFINSDYELDSTKLHLIYSNDGFVNADSIPLVATDTPTKFEANLSITEPGITKYYISAGNKRNQIYKMPGIAPEKTYSVVYGQDVIAPVITHQPIPFMRQNELSEEIVVEAKDNLGVNFVKVEYIVNQDAPLSLNLSLDSKNTYKELLSFSEGSLVDGDSIRYRILVEDKAINKNTSVFPEEGYITFYIEGIYDPVSDFNTDFNTASRNFISSDFTIETLSNFADGALHSIHPYESPEKENMTYEYVTQLKYPIIIKEGGIINYDEIVLVEPGDAGTVFGDEKFWDYVIVEGSKDNGKTWLPLIDGYDSGANTTWTIIYNSSVSDGNSTTFGTKEMFINREFYINEKNNFEVGDTILIQFRLYSDSFANGWGWCIDNLSIQDTETDATSLSYFPGELMLYPNPVEDKLMLSGTFKTKTDKIKILLFNNLGQLIQTEEFFVTENSVQETIEMNKYSPGLYFISVEFENGQKINRKIIKK